jgi:hypothetical protein
MRGLDRVSILVRQMNCRLTAGDDEVNRKGKTNG